MAITYDAGTNTITVTGNSSDLLQDIYDEDVANGWGVFHKQGSRSFYSEAYIKTGDGSTSTSLSDQLAVLEFSTALSGALLEQDKSTLDFGVLLNAEKKTTANGVCIIFNKNSGNPIVADEDSVTNLYSCSIYCVKDWYPRNDIILKGSGKVYNCIFLGVDPVSWSANIEVYNTEIYFDRWIKNCNCDFENCFLWTSGAYTFLISADYTVGDVTLKDVVAKGAATGFYFGFYAGQMAIINGDLDNWTVNWNQSPNAKLLKRVEFDVICKHGEEPIEGVSAVGEYINPYGQAFSVSTGPDGKIATQTIDHGFFDQAHGSTEQLKTPLKVTYSKPGYQTVVKYYPMDRKTVDTVVMHKAVKVFLDLGMPDINLKKTDPENKMVMAL